MGTPDQLYAECCRTPGEDTVRGALADALDERGDPGDAARATFIRAQLELKAMGRPRKVADHAAITSRGGPDYFHVSVDHGFAQEGDRLDVHPYLAEVDRERGKRVKVLHGLKVVRVEYDPQDYVDWLVVKRDADSTPFPTARWKELRATCRSLLTARWPMWTGTVALPPGPNVPGCLPSRLCVTRTSSGSVDTHFETRFRRGLPDAVEAAWVPWRWFAVDHVLAQIPLATARLVTWPQIQWQDDPGRMVRQYALAGRELPGPSPRVVVEVSRRELDAQPDPDVMPPRVARELLRKRWPSVCEWLLPGDPDTDYWTADED